MDVAVVQRDVPQKILVWRKQPGVRDRDAKKVVVAAGVDPEMAYWVLGVLGQSKQERLAYGTQLGKCLQQLSESKRLGGNMHIRLTNKITGESRMVYWRLANWLSHALTCEDEILIAMKVKEIQDYLGGKDTGIVIK